jgi:glycosyltransferase involved in cell wall biosynthesis
MVGGLLSKPGKLLLNMLIKNEAEHLRRTLPRWAQIVDYWLVGVDDANTDESPEIIKQYLGHLPGEIVIVCITAVYI